MEASELAQIITAVESKAQAAAVTGEIVKSLHRAITKMVTACETLAVNMLEVAQTNRAIEAKLEAFSQVALGLKAAQNEKRASSWLRKNTNLDAVKQKELKELLEIHFLRLHELKKHIAKSGIDAPAEIVTEKNDLENIIKKIQSKLEMK